MLPRDSSFGWLYKIEIITVYCHEGHPAVSIDYVHCCNHNDQLSPTASFADTFKTLFWVAATNFVFPVLFSLTQIIVVYCNIDGLTINDIVLVNTSIAVIGVVFATVWAGTTNWTQNRSQTAIGASEPSRVVFQHQSELSGVSTGRVEEGERVEFSKGSESVMEFKVESSI